MKKLVLAYSGGLDTSYCAKFLSKEEGFEVHAVSVNTGGFSQEEIEQIKEKALALGAASYTSLDAVQSFYDKVVKYLIFGNVLRNNTYPLSVSAERIVQAVEIVAHAKKIGAEYIAHGSTGAGNDQVRFDMIFQTLAPNIKIITPIRDNKLAREEEIKYLQEIYGDPFTTLASNERCRFNAPMSGYVDGRTDRLKGVGTEAAFWCATEQSDKKGYAYVFDANFSTFTLTWMDKSSRLSCRCVKEYDPRKTSSAFLKLADCPNWPGR